MTTYDQWKTTNPRDYEPEEDCEPEGPFGSCDCCDARNVPLHNLTVCGIETYACDDCAYPDERQRMEMEIGNA